MAHFKGPLLAQDKSTNQMDDISSFFLWDFKVEANVDRYTVLIVYLRIFLLFLNIDRRRFLRG